MITQCTVLYMTLIWVLCQRSQCIDRNRLINFFLFYVFAAILPVIAELILLQRKRRKQMVSNDNTSNENQDDVTRIFLSDLMLLLNPNKDNRR